jgi:hypothetical protein
VPPRTKQPLRLHSFQNGHARIVAHADFNGSKRRNASAPRPAIADWFVKRDDRRCQRPSPPAAAAASAGPRDRTWRGSYGLLAGHHHLTPTGRVGGRRGDMIGVDQGAVDGADPRGLCHHTRPAATDLALPGLVAVAATERAVALVDFTAAFAAGLVLVADIEVFMGGCPLRSCQRQPSGHVAHADCYLIERQCQRVNHVIVLAVGERRQLVEQHCVPRCPEHTDPPDIGL